MDLYRKGEERHKSPPVRLVKIFKIFILQNKFQLMQHQVRSTDMDLGLYSERTRFECRMQQDFFACHSALRLVGQEPELSQATDMALACCFLGKVIGVGCHYFPPPLDIPTFAAKYLYVCTTREILVAKGGIMGENIVR